MNDLSSHSKPLTAPEAALVSARELRVELSSLLARRELSPGLRLRAQRVYDTVRSREIFVERAIDDFDFFVDSLEVDMAREVRTAFVADEHHVDGGATETHLTEFGECLRSINARVRELAHEALGEGLRVHALDVVSSP